MEQRNPFTTYWSLCQPFEFPDLWKWLPLKGKARRGPSDPAVALATLIEHHTEEDLVASKLVTTGSDGNLTLSRGVSDAGVPLIGLMTSDKAAFTEMVTTYGCLSGRKWPLFAMWSDRYNRQTHRSDFLLTATLEDCIFFRTIGIAAAPILGLTKLGHQGVELLTECFDLPIPLDREPVGIRSPDYQPRLTLVGWSPLRLDLATPPEVRAAMQFLGSLNKLRRFDIGEIGFWQPTREWLDMSRLAVDQQQLIWLQEAMYESLSEAPNLGLQLSQENEAPMGLAKATLALHKSQQSGSRGRSYEEKRNAARAQHGDMITEQLVGPLLKDAESASDPVEKVLRLQLAQLVDLHAAKLVTARELALRPDMDEGDTTGRRGANATREVLSLAKQIMALTREIQKWDRRHRTSDRRLPRRGTAFPPYERSVSASRN